MAGIPGVYIYDEQGNVVGATGGKLAAFKNIQNNPNFYKEIGATGGKASGTGGFAKRADCNCDVITGKHTKPQCAGKRGGTVSRRNKLNEGK